MKILNKQKGFTLLEILLVIAIIAVLAGIVIFAINPGKQLADGRNAQRKVDINTILNAVYQYSIDNGGDFPALIDSATATAQLLGTSGSGCDVGCSATTTVATCLDLKVDLSPVYLVDMPTDPRSSSATNTGYYINKNDNGRIIVGACNPERGETIKVIQ